MSCKCQECGNYYKVDIGVSDELWLIIKPEGKSDGMLCGSCICKKIEDLDVYNSFELVKN